jgi:hypothetical protein
VTRDEKLQTLRGVRYRLEKVAAASDGDTARACEAAIVRVRLALFVESQPSFPLVVSPRAQDASPRPHDV